MLKIRRPLGRLIFNMGIAILGKTVFLIETAPWSLFKKSKNKFASSYHYKNRSYIFIVYIFGGNPVVTLYVSKLLLVCRISPIADTTHMLIIFVTAESVQQKWNDYRLKWKHFGICTVVHINNLSETFYQCDHCKMMYSSFKFQNLFTKALAMVTTPTKGLITDGAILETAAVFARYFIKCEIVTVRVKRQNLKTILSRKALVEISSELPHKDIYFKFR